MSWDKDKMVQNKLSELAVDGQKIRGMTMQKYQKFHIWLQNMYRIASPRYQIYIITFYLWNMLTKRIRKGNSLTNDHRHRNGTV